MNQPAFGRSAPRDDLFRRGQMQNMVFYWDYDDRIKPSTL